MLGSSLDLSGRRPAALIMRKQLSVLKATAFCTETRSMEVSCNCRTFESPIGSARGAYSANRHYEKPSGPEQPAHRAARQPHRPGSIVCRERLGGLLTLLPPQRGLNTPYCPANRSAQISSCCRELYTVTGSPRRTHSATPWPNGARSTIWMLERDDALEERCHLLGLCSASRR
jgi:hypothetical protein